MNRKKDSDIEIKKNKRCNRMIFNFDQYLEKARGLSPGTREKYSRYVRVFLLSQLKPGKQIKSLRAKDIIQFILSYTRKGGPKRAQHMIYPLRSFFRYLRQTHRINEELVDCIPTISVSKYPTFPVFLSAQEMQELLSSCNRNTKIGLRDFAVLMLLTQLGLRACEVCRLTLDDIDWDMGEIIIHSKGSTIIRFPIFPDLGEALVAYLQHGRPSCSSNSFFICSKKPQRGFKSSDTVRSILRSALRRADLNPEKKGTHLLRHSFAMQMLNQGATLQEIGSILGHKSIHTTAIYAKVDFDKLRKLSLPWPSGSNSGGDL